MKRILSLAILATAMLASSCALKDDFKGTDSDFATVSVTVGEPGTVSTRAIGDGTTVNQLHYAVYDEGGVLIADLGDVKDVASFPTQVEITLAKGQTYSIVFWAQNSGTTAYSYTDGDLKNITIDYTGANNDEARDAFFKTVSHTVTGDIELDVTLERPFAQINLGVTEEDWNDAKVAGIEVKESEVVISNAATSLDLFNGTVGNGESVTYTASVIPGEDLMVDFDKNGTKEAYKYLSLSYILVCDETQTPDNEGMYGTNSSLVNTTFTLSTTKAPVVVKVDNLPVQRNWRTNVIGRMLTGDITFNIDIDPIFDGEENYPDTLEEKLYFAGLNGGTVTLSEDVTLEYPIVVEGAMVVELNGHNITAPLFTESNGVIAEGDTDSYAFWVKEGGDLTINGEGSVKTQPCKYSIAVWAQGGNVVINGGDYENAGEGSDLIYASAKGNVIINGGKFTACEKAAGVQGTAQPRSTLNLKDNTGSSIVVYGGSFYKFNPADNASEGPHTNFVAEGYYVSIDGDWYVVSTEHYDAIIHNVNELLDAMNDSAVESIGLYPGTYDLGADVFYLNSSAKRIQSINSEDKAIVLGKIVANRDIIVKNVSFKPNAASVKNVSTSSYGSYVNGSYASIILINKVNATFEGCTFSELHDTYAACAINYFVEATDKVLKVNKCIFTGSTKAIYSKVLCEITNCKFDLSGGVPLYVWPRAYAAKGICTFTDNEAITDALCKVGLLSQTGNYANLEFNVQGNNGTYTYNYAWTNSVRCATDGSVTFADGSDRFSIAADGKPY